MRGVDYQQSGMFSYISAEQRVPQDHPLRAIRVMAEAALKETSWRFAAVYARSGRPSIAPEKLLRALLLQVLYTVRSERLLMEQLDYNLLFRWFVGLNLDDPVWDVTVFTKNRERLVKADVAKRFFELVVECRWRRKRVPFWRLKRCQWCGWAVACSEHNNGEEATALFSQAGFSAPLAWRAR